MWYTLYKPPARWPCCCIIIYILIKYTKIYLNKKKASPLDLKGGLFAYPWLADCEAYLPIRAIGRGVT